MATGLAALDHALRALGHPGGLQVLLVDDDSVSAANVARQPTYFECDVGLPKATILANRINQAYPSACFTAARERVTERSTVLHDVDIVIGCVDTVASRRGIHKAISRGNPPAYWMDLGNRSSDCQVVLGEPQGRKRDWAGRLPTIMDLNPHFLDPEFKEPEDVPSCSLPEALEAQGLFINRTVATFALSLLEDLFRTGSLRDHGVFVSRRSATPIRVDAAVWARLGFRSRARAVREDLKRSAHIREAA